MSKSVECYNKMVQIRNEYGLNCKAIIHDDYDVNLEIGQGAIFVNDMFAIIYK